MRNEDVAFISGFLRAFALANASVNYGPDFWLSVVPINGDQIESVTAYHEHTRLQYEKIYKQFDLRPAMRPLEEWKTKLPLLIKKWFFEGQSCLRFEDDQISKKNWIVEQLETKIRESLTGEIRLWELTIFFSENEADDWLIEDSDGLYHLHLGWSD